MYRGVDNLWIVAVQLIGTSHKLSPALQRALHQAKGEAVKLSPIGGAFAYDA